LYFILLISTSSMSIVEVDNLLLINKELLVYWFGDHTIPDINQNVKYILKILPFKLNLQGSRLIIFTLNITGSSPIIDGTNDDKTELLIVQYNSPDKYQILHPMNISYYPEFFIPYISKYFIIDMNIIDYYPHHIPSLTDININDKDDIRYLLLKYHNKNIDKNFIYQLLKLNPDYNDKLPNIYSTSSPNTIFASPERQLGTPIINSPNINSSVPLYIPTTPIINSPIRWKSPTINSHTGSFVRSPPRHLTSIDNNVDNITYNRNQPTMIISTPTGTPIIRSPIHPSLQSPRPNSPIHSPIIPEDEYSSPEEDKAQLKPHNNYDIPQNISPNPRHISLSSPIRPSLSSPISQSTKDIIAYTNSQSSYDIPSTTLIVPNIYTQTGKIIDRLGEGVYGIVHETSAGLAIKIYNDEIMKATTLVETSILAYLNHPNIIKIINIQLSPIIISMPIANRNLFGLIPELSDRKSIFYQIFSGIQYCHSKNIWHRDIKPENILLFINNVKDSNGNILRIDIEAKIADFGISVISPRKNLTNDVVTLFWRPPEITINEVITNPNDRLKYDETVDEWSIGVMLLDIVMKSTTFPDYSSKQHLLTILRVLGIPRYDDWKEGHIAFDNFITNDIPNLKTNKELINAINIIEELEYEPTLSEMIKQSTSYNNTDPNEMIFNTNQDEIDVIMNTVTWPTKRYTCDTILNMKYFDDVRPSNPNLQLPNNSNNSKSKDEITLNNRSDSEEDIDNSNDKMKESIVLLPPLPARTKESEFELLVSEQVTITKSSWIKTNERKIILEWLIAVVNEFRMDIRCLFHAIIFFDVVCSKYEKIQSYKLQGYAITCLKISSELLIDDLFFSTKRYSNVTAYSVSEEEIHEYQNEILTIIDFQTIFTSCENFVYNQIINIVSEIKYKKVMYYAFLLLLNYDYTIKYTSLQIAQISVRAALGREFTESISWLEGDNLYTDDIQSYLSSYSPSEITKLIHDKLF